jgi:hypothetical protein
MATGAARSLRYLSGIFVRHRWLLERSLRCLNAWISLDPGEE